MRTPFEKILLALLFFALFSCKTTPTIPDFSLMTSVPLDSGASVYFFADVKEAAPFLDLLPISELKDKNTKQMMDRTSFFAAALFPKESGRRFQLISWGNYPNSSAGMALSMNKSWEKQSSKSGPYWYSADNKLSIVLHAKQAYAASWLESHASPIAEPAGIPFPESYGEFRLDAPLSCWVENPGSGINRIFDNREMPFQIPAQRLFANLYTGNEVNGTKLYYGVIRMQFSGAAQARSIASLFNMARNMFSDSNWPLARYFFVNPPVQNDRNIDITTGLLTERELSLLLQMLLLNWT